MEEEDVKYVDSVIKNKDFMFIFKANFYFIYKILCSISEEYKNEIMVAMLAISEGDVPEKDGINFLKNLTRHMSMKGALKRLSIKKQFNKDYLIFGLLIVIIILLLI